MVEEVVEVNVEFRWTFAIDHCNVKLADLTILDKDHEPRWYQQEATLAAQQEEGCPMG